VAYPDNTSQVLRFLGYVPFSQEANSGDFFVESVLGAVSLSWLHTDPQPTEQQITDTLASQAFLDWEAEHGGDPTLTARRIAKEATSTPAGRLLVALVSAMAKNGVFGAATKQQIVSSVLAEIDLGEAD
jgi:hypothetical protein